VTGKLAEEGRVLRLWRPPLKPGEWPANLRTNVSGMPILVVIRGNSGSGKTTTARESRHRYGRGCALLEQDHLRRIVLREHDDPAMDPIAPQFIAATARTALDLGYHVVLEGILHRDRYASTLRQLIAEHPGPSHVYYLDVSFDETVRRNRERLATERFTADDMRSWYAERDLLGLPGERVLHESLTLDDTVRTILSSSGLAEAAASTPCPNRCPRCAAVPGRCG
jgi:predicted kinase